MKKFIYITVLLLILSFRAFSAEVFYSDQSDINLQDKNPRYSLKQRIKDLFDFKSGRDYDNRSGEIKGNFYQDITWQEVSGDKTKSFLDEGIKNNTELSLNLKEKLWSNYHFEGNLFLRRADNLQIEENSLVKVKQYNLKLFNKKNIFEFGDFYNEFSQFVLGTNLEGFNVSVIPKQEQKYHLIFAKRKKEDVVPESLIRYVLGFKTDFNFFKNSDIFSDFRVGVQYCNIFDDKDTVDNTLLEKNLQNSVYGIDGEFVLTKIYSMQYEIAQSVYKYDNIDNKTGLALMIRPNFNFNKLNLNYLFYQVEPNFFTETGTAINDKIQHQIVCNYKLNQRININFTENYHWDKLDGSNKTKRTLNDEKYFSLILYPLKTRKIFNIKPYINYFVRDSDDVQNTSDAKTLVAGVGINDNFNNDKSFYGVNYEYRQYNKEWSVLFEEVSHRTSINFGSKTKFFRKNLDFSVNPLLDLRKNSNMLKEDLNLTLNFSGKYEITDSIQTRFGHNYLNSDSGVVGGDYFNNRSYLELNYVISKKYSTRFVLRLEKNVYSFEDSTQNYEENKIFSNFISSF